MTKRKPADQWIEEINQLGRQCWLIVELVRSDIDAYRDEYGQPKRCHPEGFVLKKMDRLMFQVDGFTTVDFEIKNNRLRTICNRTLLPEKVRHGYYEDAAWQNLANDTEITFQMLACRVKKFCNLANYRISPGYES